jgi:hypothetical protein
VPQWAKEWRLYDKALVVKAEHGQIERILEYESPPEHRPDEQSSTLFKAASVEGDRAYLCTQTEILICDFPSFKIRDVISLPIFNDVHHVVAAPDGRLFVAVTGLDAVAELTPDGKLLRLVSVIGGSVWDRFSQTTDYRKVVTTKPHRSHPNFIFFLDGEPWVTRFEQRDAVPLDGKSMKAPFQLGNEGVHDGHIAGGYAYFTAVNGIVMRFNLRTMEKQSFDLNRFPGNLSNGPLGWCRGVLCDGDEIWVGLSRIRYTALRHNLDWVRHGFRDSERKPPAPTRVARYNLGRRLLVGEYNLEDAGMNTVFSIHGA